MAKNDTNKIVWLTVVGFVLSCVVAGFTTSLTHSILFGLTLFLASFSGVYGKKALESIGSFSVPIAILLMFFSHSFGKWWQYLVCYIVALFVGNGLSNFRPQHREEWLDYIYELKYIFTSQEDGFSVSFPKKPQTIDTGDYSRQYIFKSKNAICSVTVYDLREARTERKDMTGEVMLAVARVLNILDIKATETRSWDGEAVINGLPSIQLSAENANGTIYYFAGVVKANKLYELVLNVHSENDELFSKFVNSFKFID